MGPQAPWTDIGSLQNDVRNLQSEMRGKLESHEIHTINRRLDALEHTCREISSSVDGFQYRMQEMEEAIRQLEQRSSHD